VYKCETPLYGRQIVINLTGAFTMCVALGMNPQLVVSSFKTLRPLHNRLEVVRDGKITWIHDAYNSNPTGFRAAIEVAKSLSAKRKILVSPGMVELGVKQFEENKAVATLASTVFDQTLSVANINKEAFLAGFKESNNESKLINVATRDLALQWLKDNAADGDLILLENDLADINELGKDKNIFWGLERVVTRPAKS